MKMIKIAKGVYCKQGDIDKIRVKQVNNDKLATSVYIHLKNGEYIYMFFQTVGEAREYASSLIKENELEG